MASDAGKCKAAIALGKRGKGKPKADTVLARNARISNLVKANEALKKKREAEKVPVV